MVGYNVKYKYIYIYIYIKYIHIYIYIYIYTFLLRFCNIFAHFAVFRDTGPYVVRRN